MTPPNLTKQERWAYERARRYAAEERAIGATRTYVSGPWTALLLALDTLSAARAALAALAGGIDFVFENYVDGASPSTDPVMSAEAAAAYDLAKKPID